LVLMLELDEKSKLLLTLIQEELPLVERPYQALGEKIGLSEESVVALAAKLKAQRMLRQISAIFDARRLGYRSCLAACQTAQEMAAQAAAVISAHPGVSHNYARDHKFNLWFTIAVPGTSSLQAHLDVLQTESGAQIVRPLPALRVFKIGMKLDLTGAVAGEENKPAADFETQPAQRPAEKDIRFVLALQEDMEVRPDLFAPLAAQLGTTPAVVLEWALAARRAGWLRRVAGILSHQKAGFVANALGAWRVPEERIEEVGNIFARQRAITHCYQRPVYPDWPYNLFTMCHGFEMAACNKLIANLAMQLGLNDYAVLYSTKEYKKIRLRLFTGEIEEWEKAHGL